VAPAANFVTCGHCGSRLAIKRTATSAHTELLEKIDTKMDAMAERLDDLTREKEVERLDREWEADRQQFLVADKQGGKHEPSEAGGLMVAVVMGIAGLLWTGFAASIGAPVFFLLFGVLFVALAIGGGVWQIKKAGEYRAAKTAYERRREEALTGKKDDTPASG
jgi:hypothetical protein